MMPVNPYEDSPTVEPEACDLGDCKEPWAVEVDRDNGPRSLRLCECHADEWLKAERELLAEREEVSGRVPEAQQWSALFGLARAGFVNGHAKNTKRTA